MTFGALFCDARVAGLASFVAIALAFAWGSPSAAAGMALGIAGSAFNLWALWGVVKLIGRKAAEAPPPRFGAIIAVFAFLIKLPAILTLGFFSAGLGQGAMTCFLLGLGLVYSALLGWVSVHS